MSVVPLQGLGAAVFFTGASGLGLLDGLPVGGLADVGLEPLVGYLDDLVGLDTRSPSSGTVTGSGPTKRTRAMAVLLFGWVGSDTGSAGHRELDAHQSAFADGLLDVAGR
jgi:hypothetical protein